MKKLVIIPARGGSKGIPGKNIKLLNGKPLIHYTIEVAREVFTDSEICITTDDLKIVAVVESLGLSVPFLRPEKLASDIAGTYEVLLHALDYYEKKGYKPEIIVLLQPTSPFRTGKQITKALELFDDKCDMVVSVKETKSNPYYVLFEENDDGWLEKSKKGSFKRRQDCPKVWEYNGAIYIIKVSSVKAIPLYNFTKVRKYMMDEFSSIDLDTLLDWEFSEFLLEKHSTSRLDV